MNSSIKVFLMVVIVSVGGVVFGQQSLIDRAVANAAAKTINDLTASPQVSETGSSSSQSSKPSSGKAWTIPVLGMKLVYVMSGSFQMGSSDGDQYEKPVHRVRLTKSYWIGKYEVTQKEYQSIMGNNPSESKGYNKPVEQVSWSDAVKFCNILTKREQQANRLSPAYEYRLPTEAEWEFAARGGNKSRGYKYSGSDYINEVAWHGGNSGKQSHIVGTKSPNELGIYDMSGNVYEWCSDWYKPYSNKAVTDPKGPLSGTMHILRGGGWYVPMTMYCRTTRRSSGSLNHKRSIIGFRIVLAPKINKKLKAVKSSIKIADKPSSGKAWRIPGLKMKFVYVAPGSFYMGASDGARDEKPVRRIKLAKGYWIGKYEVTQSEYRSVMGNNPSRFKGANKPVEQVSWNDAVQFCTELTAREHAANRLPSDCKYRLPTEAEWEFVARGGIKSHGYKYSGSSSMDSVAWYRNNSGKKTHKVGIKSPNELEIHDMSGNVWEWCSDWHGKYGRGSTTDPTGASSGSYRVFRGGGWYFLAYHCRSTGRGRSRPSYRDGNLGFRVVMVISKKKESAKEKKVKNSPKL